MRPDQLKSVRVGVSLCFFLATTLLFLDFRNWIPATVNCIVLSPQFIPSLLKFLQGAAVAASGFAVILLMTVLAGRVYCSTLCPLGTFQDLAGALNRKRARQVVRRYRRPQNLLRYSVLLLTAMLLLGGSNLMLNLLDPFSTYGRIITNIFRPLGILVNNGGAVVLENFGVYTLAREHWAVMAPLSLGVAAAALLLLLWLSCGHGRLYCNTLCPVGTLLGLVSMFSALRLRIDPDSCTNCRRCILVCKADCIDLASGVVDMSRCVGCFNCLGACKTCSIGYARRDRLQVRREESGVSPDRRKLLLKASACLLALSGLGMRGARAADLKKIVQAKPTTVPVVMTSPVSPPGSVSVDHFTDTCTACHLCVSACPPQILLPSFLEYGVSGMMQPRMNFTTGHCTYECTICGDVCPTGAILPLEVAEKKLTQTGVARFIKENCVVFTDITACGACSEHCPTKAVAMVPYANPLGRPLGIPEVKAELCIGCGGCEHACPTRPYKAIFVDGNKVHGQAQKPVVQKIDQSVDLKKDFPF